MRSKLLRQFQPLSGRIEISLAQGEHPPVRPGRRLARDNLRRTGQFAIGANIVAHLQSGKTDIEGRNKIRVGLRRPIWQA